mmetsp:Transcript_26622/g.41481  ORF Transcript_26622/g.41481 Transcript_26622/m.41481 type:complete len:242 (+) Transcript_26622:1519-2244(+)
MIGVVHGGTMDSEPINSSKGITIFVLKTEESHSMIGVVGVHISLFLGIVQIGTWTSVDVGVVKSSVNPTDSSSISLFQVFMSIKDSLVDSIDNAVSVHLVGSQTCNVVKSVPPKTLRSRMGVNSTQHHIFLSVHRAISLISQLFDKESLNGSENHTNIGADKHNSVLLVVLNDESASSETDVNSFGDLDRVDVAHHHFPSRGTGNIIDSTTNLVVHVTGIFLIKRKFLLRNSKKGKPNYQQ